MWKLSGLVLVLLFHHSPGFAAEPDAARAEKTCAEAVETWQVPGAAVVVVRGDDTLLLKGFGRRSLGKADPVSPDTVFPIASCSKAFTTTLLAMLVDDGLLDWDDPLSKHFTGFTLSDPNAQALLSVRDLLCHRCGINGHDLLWYHAPWGIDDVLRRASRLPLDYPFRGGYRYSTIPFLAAGRMIEQRKGEKWEKLVQTRICEPLGMKNTYLAAGEIPEGAEVATGNKLLANGKTERMPAYDLRIPNPAGSVHTTARDLAAWLKFHLGEGLSPTGLRLVSARNLRETHTPQNLLRMEGVVKELNPDTVQMTYAMGWLAYDHRGKKVISHGGMIDGFRCQITFLPDEKLGIAVLGNLHDTRFNVALVNSLIDLYCGLNSRDWNGFFKKVVSEDQAERERQRIAFLRLRDPAVKPTLALAEYAGEYSHPAYGAAKVAMEGEKLKLAWSSFECPLDSFRGDVFQVTDGFFADGVVPFGVEGGKVKTLRFVGVEFKRQ